MPEVPSLGRRGGGWVVLQLVLFGAIAAVCALGPRWPGSAGRWPPVAGAVLALAGTLLVAASARVLGRGLTPFPRPPQEGRLVEHGPYRVVRHPIYAGGILFFAGLATAFSPVAFVPTTALALLWALKARVEERFLRAAFRGYTAYAERTRYRLLPFVY